MTISSMMPREAYSMVVEDYPVAVFFCVRIGTLFRCTGVGFPSIIVARSNSPHDMLQFWVTDNCVRIGIRPEA